MKPADRRQMMLAGPIVPTILTLAAPNVLNVAMQSLVSISDSWFVAQLGLINLAALALVFPAQMALDMATVGGARAIGLDSSIGSIEPGKRADLITVSMNSARQTPMYDAVSHLVYVTRGDDVRNTIVNGKLLMRDRKVLTLDEADVLAQARRLAQKVRDAVQ